MTTKTITTYVPQPGDGTVGLLRGMTDGLHPPLVHQNKKSHPWRKWVDNPNDKQKFAYDPKNRIPQQDRMGLK